MKIGKLVVATVIAVIGFALHAAVVIGEVGNDFASSLEYAKKHNVPIAVAWGNEQCSYCCTLDKMLQESEDLAEWLEEKRIIFVNKHEDYDCQDDDYIAAGEWVKSLSKTRIIAFPYIGLYWLKSDGTVAVSTYFSGRKGRMPVTIPKNDLAKQLVGTLEKYFGSYSGDTPEPQPFNPEQAHFATLDTAEDRLEATKDTEKVFVPVARNLTTKKEENILRVICSTGIDDEYTINWSVGEDYKFVPVELDDDTFYTGKRITLKMYDVNTNLLDTSYIWMVKEPENHPTNPHWIGDYSALTLPYGEWTLDYETAKAKLQLQGGYMMTVFSGVKWCPHCIGIDNSLFADSTFYSWAKKNKVLLVLFDQPRWDSTEKCQYIGPRLLSFDNSFSSSGASYLSRNGLSGDDVEVLDAMKMQWKLTREWLAPETTASRLSNPTILMMNENGTAVAARMNTYELSDRSYPTEENINRLNDLIALQDADENEGYRTVTPLTLSAGESTETTLHVNARAKFYTLEKVEADKYLKVTAISSDKNASDIKVTIYSGSNAIATGTSRAITDEALSEDEVSAGISVKVESFSEKIVYGKNTSFDVNIACEIGDEEMVRTVVFSSISKAEQKLLNPCLYSKCSSTIPVYKEIALGGKSLIGTLAVSISAANKISAKLTGENTVSFSGTWLGINLLSGKVSTTLTKNDWSLQLAMNAEGDFETTILDDDTSIGSGEVKSISIFSDFVGSYTVTLVDVNEKVGTGYLSIKIAKTGKATISGMMPNGVSISSSTSASLNQDGTITVPVYKSTSKGTLTLALAVDPLASATWGDEGFMDTVNSIAGCLATWTDAKSNITAFNIYGGYWKTGTSPLAICELFDLSDKLNFKLSDGSIDEARAISSGFKLSTKTYLTSLSFSKASGVFSGKAKVYAPNGNKVTATVKGVLLPGWIDCGCTTEPVVERPYGSGTLYYTYKMDGVSYTESMPIDIEASAAE